MNKYQNGYPNYAATGDRATELQSYPNSGGKSFKGKPISEARDLLLTVIFSLRCKVIHFELSSEHA